MRLLLRCWAPLPAWCWLCHFGSVPILELWILRFGGYLFWAYMLKDKCYLFWFSLLDPLYCIVLGPCQLCFSPLCWLYCAFSGLRIGHLFQDLIDCFAFSPSLLIGRWLLFLVYVCPDRCVRRDSNFVVFFFLSICFQCEFCYGCSKVCQRKVDTMMKAFCTLTSLIENLQSLFGVLISSVFFVLLRHRETWGHYRWWVKRYFYFLSPLLLFRIVFVLIAVWKGGFPVAT